MYTVHLLAATNPKIRPAWFICSEGQNQTITSTDYYSQFIPTIFPVKIRVFTFFVYNFDLFSPDCS